MVDWVQTAIGAGGFAAGAAAGIVFSHLSLRWRRQDLDKAMERAEFLLQHDAASSAKELESSLEQLSAAAEATRTANERARLAEARVASLSAAFRNLRSDPLIARIGKLDKPARRLAPKVAPPPKDADERRTPRYRAVPPLASVERIEPEPVVAEERA